MSSDWAKYRDTCSIVGIGRTEYSKDSGRSELTLATEAALAAIDDSGFAVQAVDGIVRCDMDRVSHNALAGSLGLKDLSYWGEVGPGGSAPCAMVAQAAAAIQAGLATTVLVYRSLNGRSQSRYGSAIGEDAGTGGFGTYDEYYSPFGLMTAPQTFALFAKRHMIEYGTTPEGLGAIALTCRANANRTPHAQMHDKPLTMADYLQSRYISEPLRLFDCCLETDGACAVIVTASDRGKDARKTPVLIRAAAQATPVGLHGGMMFPAVNLEDITRLSPGRVAPRLWSRAGLGPDDIDVAQIYDCFTISVLLQLEDYGFCKRGEGGDFALSGAIAADGSIPINTAGGNMSEGYMHGMNHIYEGVRQIRGESDVQLANPEVCLVTSGPVLTSSALVLRKGA